MISKDPDKLEFYEKYLQQKDCDTFSNNTF